MLEAFVHQLIPEAQQTQKSLIHFYQLLFHQLHL